MKASGHVARADCRTWEKNVQLSILLRIIDTPLYVGVAFMNLCCNISLTLTYSVAAPQISELTLGKLQEEVFAS